MERVIVIYELVPDSSQIYDLEVTAEEMEMLKRCHGKMVNHDELEEHHPAHEILPTWLEKKKENKIFDGNIAEEQLPYKVDTACTIILTGFLL